MSEQLSRSEQIAPELLTVQDLLIQKRDLNINDQELIGYNNENKFQATVSAWFPTPDDLSYQYIFGTERKAPEPEFDTSEEQQDINEQIRGVVESAKKHVERLAKCASWMIDAFSASDKVNGILGHTNLYYEESEDYLRGVGARFCGFHATEPELKQTTDIVVVSGESAGNPHTGRLLNIQPLLNIAWVLPSDAPWSAENVVALDLDLNNDGEINIKQLPTSEYAPSYTQPALEI